MFKSAVHGDVLPVTGLITSNEIMSAEAQMKKSIFPESVIRVKLKLITGMPLSFD